jgi:hypothetical protein
MSKPFTPTQVAIAKPIIRVFSHLNTWVYRLTNGKIGGIYKGRMPVLLLTVVGRKSGRRLTSPLTYLADGDRLVVAASRAGMDPGRSWSP